MLNENHKHASCAAADQVVAYLYGEIDAQEKIKFQAHIKKCSFCADELAAFGSVRASVREWRDADFSILELPTFDIPTKELSTVKSEKQSVSWLAQIKKLFVFRPALATAALAALVLCVGVTLFVLNSSKADDLAEIDKKDAQKAVVSPTIEKIVSPTADKSLEKLPETVDKTSAPEYVRQPRPATGKSVVKISTVSDEKIAPVRENKNTKIRDKKPPSQKQQVPNLTYLDVVVDKSIRLADLFEEIGAK